MWYPITAVAAVCVAFESHQYLEQPIGERFSLIEIPLSGLIDELVEVGQCLFSQATFAILAVIRKLSPFRIGPGFLLGHPKKIAIHVANHLIRTCRVSWSYDPVSDFIIRRGVGVRYFSFAPTGAPMVLWSLDLRLAPWAII